MRILGLIVAVHLLLPAVASARSESEFAYPFSRVWTIAVRLLRIDLDCPIDEKDKEEGYFFFEYRDGKRSFTGSAEIIPKTIEGAKGVRVVIQLSALPRYVERMILDRLARKLDQELGRPIKAKKEEVDKKPVEKQPDDSKTPPKKKSAPK
jgi:hypothetical protein